MNNQKNPFVSNNPNIIEIDKNDIYNKEYINEKEIEIIHDNEYKKK